MKEPSPFMDDGLFLGLILSDKDRFDLGLR